MHVELTSSDVVPVQAVGRNASRAQVLLKREAQGCFASARQPSEPNAAAPKATSLAYHLRSLVPAHMSRHERDVGCFVRVLAGEDTHTLTHTYKLSYQTSPPVSGHFLR